MILMIIDRYTEFLSWLLLKVAKGLPQVRQLMACD